VSAGLTEVTSFSNLQNHTTIYITAVVCYPKLLTTFRKVLWKFFLSLNKKLTQNYSFFKLLHFLCTVILQTHQHALVHNST